MLTTTLAKISDIEAPALAGFSAWPLDALAFESDLAAVYPENQIVYFSPGRNIIGAAPAREGDSCAEARRWVAQNNATTLLQDGAVLGGLPRYQMPTAGFYSDLDAPVTDLTIAALVRVPNVSGFKSLATIGVNAATRAMLYITGNDIAYQHGTGDVKTSTGTTVVADQWLVLLSSFQASDNALRVYANSTALLMSETMANDIPAETRAAIGSTTAGAQPLVGEVALVMMWDRALHTDVVALAKVMTAIGGLAALT